MILLHQPCATLMDTQEVAARIFREKRVCQIEAQAARFVAEAVILEDFKQARHTYHAVHDAQPLRAGFVVDDLWK